MDDLISRQAAMEALAKFVPYAICDESTESYTNGLTDAYNLILQLPSAQPERKGKWIEMGTNKDGTHSIRCSKCGGGYKTRGHARSIATKAKYKFCPNCGAKMDEDEKIAGAEQ